MGFTSLGSFGETCICIKVSQLPYETMRFGLVSTFEQHAGMVLVLGTNFHSSLVLSLDPRLSFGWYEACRYYIPGI